MAWLLLLLLLGSILGPGPHPISEYRARLAFAAEQVEFTVDFTWDDVYLNQQVAAGPDRRFAAADLQRALVAFESQLVQGTKIYDGAGAPLELRSATLACDPPPAAGLTLEGLKESGGRLHLDFAMPGEPDEHSILLDWGCWRVSVSTTIVCEFAAPDGRAGSVYWRERQRFPLLPPPDAPRFELRGTPVFAVQPLEETLTGFSYVYLEDDHVRHELVLPLLAVGWLLAEETDLSAIGRLGKAQRAEVRRALEATYDDPPILYTDGRPLPADEVLVRWFTRESVQQGVVTGDEPIPIATGFVGVLSVHPIDAPLDNLAFDAGPWRFFLADHVVSMITADTVERSVTSDTGARVHWQGWASPPAPVPVLEVVAPGTDRRRPVRLIGGVAAALLVLGAVLALVGRRWIAVGLAIVAALAGGGALGLASVDGGPTPERSAEILGALVENVYRACGRQDEEQALSLLAQASAGPLLEDLYLELRGQIRGPWATGAGTRVTGVELEECEVVQTEARSLTARCTWRIDAAIEHWGHVHERTLRVTARVHACVEAERWRLAEVRLLDKQVVSAGSQPRR